MVNQIKSYFKYTLNVESCDVSNIDSPASWPKIAAKRLSREIIVARHSRRHKVFHIIYIYIINPFLPCVFDFGVKDITPVCRQE